MHLSLKPVKWWPFNDGKLALCQFSKVAKYLICYNGHILNNITYSNVEYDDSLQGREWR